MPLRIKNSKWYGKRRLVDSFDNFLFHNSLEKRGQVGQPGRRGQVIFSDSLKKTKFLNFDYIQWPSWTTKTRWTSGFISLIEKNKMCKFWLYTVAKLDDQDEVDKWFYQSHWKKKKWVDFDFIQWQSWTTRTTWTSGFFSLIEKNKICKFWLYTVAKLDDKDDVDKWFSQTRWKKLNLQIFNIYSGQVGRPGWRGQVIFSDSME